jgi:N-acetylglutamate synthase-like GNAT family acetyltransferase
MRKTDLGEARRIFRVAFGTFIGVPDPDSFQADREYIATRWRAHPEAALAAEAEGRLVGSNILTHWGSFGFFGPLTVHPELWGRKVAQSLLAPTVDLFAQWGVREAGLFTFAHSAKHVGLYQKFGFWPRFLTALMSKSVNGRQTAAIEYSALGAEERRQGVGACRELTAAIYEGLDVTREIRAVEEQRLGETLLLWGGGRLEAFAICHCGEGTEAGRDNCLVKFAAVRPSSRADHTFDRLLAACEALAAARGARRIEAGVNLNRSQAYRQMLRQGFRTTMQGVAMHKPDSPAYNRPEVFVVDDWR